MIKSLLKHNIKSNLGLFLFVSGLMLIYTSMSIATYDPDNIDTLLMMMSALPEGLITAMGGFDGMTSELVNFLGAFLYGFILLVFPLFYTVTVAIRLIAGPVDTGFMAFLLATPHKRSTIILNQALFHIISTIGSWSFKFLHY